MLFIMDVYKLYKEEKPPIPIVTVDGKQAEAVTGSYKWHGTKEKAENPVKLMLDIDGEYVNEQQKLFVSFPVDAKPEKITISQWNTVPGVEKKSQTSDTFAIPTSFSNHPHQAFYFKIKAEWNNDYSTYYVKLHIQDQMGRFKDFLAKEPGKLSVLAILPPDTTAYDLPSEAIHLLDAYHVSHDLEDLKETFPEIKATTPPVYLVFNTGVLMQTFDDKEELIQMLKDHHK